MKKFIPFLLLIPSLAFAFPSAGIIDNFNRASLGADYSFIQGSGAIIDSQYIGGSTASENQALYATSYNANQEIYLTFAVLPAEGEGISIFTRYNSSTNSGYDFQIIRRAAGAEQDELRLYVYTSGSFGTLLGSAVWNTWQAGDAFGYELNGSSIKCYAKAAGTSTWTEVISVTDSTYSSGGRFSFGMFGQTARYDDFGGGNIVTSFSVIGVTQAGVSTY